jgi:hypothetical protein
MKTDYAKSTGQGLFSKLDQKIFENDTCIISRLQSRSLTGRNPQIKVHRHFRDRLNLIWQAKTNEMLATRLIGHGRHKIQIKQCFTDLVLGGSENLCNCVSLNYFYRPSDGRKD